MVIIFEEQTAEWKQEFLDILKLQQLYEEEMPVRYVNDLFKKGVKKDL